MSKKLEQKQRRREAEAKRKAEERRAKFRRNALTIGIAVAVIVGVVALIISDRQQDVAPSEPIGVSLSAAGCGEIEEKEFGEEEREHVPDGQDVEYADDPPMGGPHWATPPDATFYSSEVPEEAVVHNLEHGQIVIWYDPGADDETKQQIQDYVEREDEAALSRGESVGPLVAVPREGMDASTPIVMTAWGASQGCAQFSSAAVDEFRVTYQGRGPEQIAATYTKPEE